MCGVTDEGVRALRAVAEHCAGLQHMGVRDCQGVTNEGVRAVAEHCAGLHHLGVGSRQGDSDTRGREGSGRVLCWDAAPGFG